MGKLSNILENNILNLDGVIEPFAGMHTGFGRQEEVAKKVNQRTLIAGKGIKLTQGATGIIIEAVDINQTFTYSQEREGYNAVVGEIASVLGNGIYTIKFLTGTMIQTSDFLVEVNNSMLDENQYALGDKVLCFPVNMPVVKGGYIVDE